MEAKELKNFTDELNSLEKKIKGKTHLSENDYTKLSIISLEKIQIGTIDLFNKLTKTLSSNLRETSRVVIFLFLLAWFKNEIIWVISNYLEFAILGFPKLSVDSKYNFLVIIPVTSLVSILIYKLTHRDKK